jgi:hypothetical protein
MKTRAEFLREAKNGNMYLKMDLIYGESLQQILKQDPERAMKRTQKTEKAMTSFRKVDKVQTNGIYIQGSFLEIPNATQLEYDGETLKIFRVGHRPLNEKETEVMNEWKKITETEEYKRNSLNDAYTDGSQTFFQEKRFFTNKNMLYLFGTKESQGRMLVNDYRPLNGKRLEGQMIRDNSIRGELDLQYTVKFL